MYAYLKLGIFLTLTKVGNISISGVWNGEHKDTGMSTPKQAQTTYKHFKIIWLSNVPISSVPDEGFPETFRAH